MKKNRIFCMKFNVPNKTLFQFSLFVHILLNLSHLNFSKRPIRIYYDQVGTFRSIDNINGSGSIFEIPTYKSKSKKNIFFCFKYTYIYIGIVIFLNNSK